MRCDVREVLQKLGRVGRASPSIGPRAQVALVALTAAAAVLGTPVARAHPLAPSLLRLDVPASGPVQMTWRTPMIRPTGTALVPHLPEVCNPPIDPTSRPADGSRAIEQHATLRCDGAALLGKTIRVEGVAESGTNVIVRVQWPDGKTSQVLIDGEQPSWTIPTPEAAPAVFPEYLKMGVEHLLTGVDHVLFVIGLLMLMGWGGKLLRAVTSFTLGHSVTLALSALGLVHLPPAPIEVGIALTIVVLALELYARRDREHTPESLLERHPWTLPACFGLLHGLGFASALVQAGVPSGDITLALFAFNLGIELGQLAVIGLAMACIALYRQALATPRWAPTAVSYAIGSVSAYWVLDRLLAVFGV